MLYNMLFQVEYYEAFLQGIPVPFGTTTIEMEQKFLTKNNESKETTPKNASTKENIISAPTEEDEASTDE